MEPLPIVKLGDLLDRVRRIAGGHQWEGVMWYDPELHALLEALLSHIRATTGRILANVPLDLGRLARTTPQRAARVDEGALLVAKADRIDINGLQRPGILLVDGSVHVGFLAGSLVVARGAVDVAHCGASVLIAGHHLRVAHEGHFGGSAGSAGASVLLSGTSIHVSHAHGTIVGAPDGVDISHAHEVSFLDCPGERHGWRDSGKLFADTGICLRESSPPYNPLAGLIELEQVAPRHCEVGGGTVTVRLKNREGERATAHEGRCLVDASGHPVPALENWRLAFTGSQYALWTDGTRFAELCEQPPRWSAPRRAAAPPPPVTSTTPAPCEEGPAKLGEETRRGLRGDEVHLWTVRYDESGRSRRDGIARTLDAAERGEVQRRDEAGWGFGLGRALLRQMLTYFFPQIRPQSWRFRREATEEPEVAFPPGMPLRMSVSTGDGVAAGALCWAVPVGVHLEPLYCAEDFSAGPMGEHVLARDDMLWNQQRRALQGACGRALGVGPHELTFSEVLAHLQVEYDFVRDVRGTPQVAPSQVPCLHPSDWQLHIHEPTPGTTSWQPHRQPSQRATWHPLRLRSRYASSLPLRRRLPRGSLTSVASSQHPRCRCPRPPQNEPRLRWRG